MMEIMAKEEGNESIDHEDTVFQDVLSRLAIDS